MRTKLLAGLAGVFLLAAAVAASPISWSFDSWPVAAGAAVSSGVADTSTTTAVTCIVSNQSAVARNFTVTYLADDRTTALFQPAAISVGATTTLAVTIGANATGTGATALSTLPTRWMKFDLAAGGAGTGRISCVGR